jgi:hypothetical protein
MTAISEYAIINLVSTLRLQLRLTQIHSGARAAHTRIGADGCIYMAQNVDLFPITHLGDGRKRRRVAC